MYLKDWEEQIEIIRKQQEKIKEETLSYTTHDDYRGLKTKGYSIVMKYRKRSWPKLFAIWLAKKLVEFAL